MYAISNTAEVSEELVKRTVNICVTVLLNLRPRRRIEPFSKVCIERKLNFLCPNHVSLIRLKILMEFCHCNWGKQANWMHSHTQYVNFVTMRRLYFYTCLSFCSQGGGSASVHAGVPPPPQSRHPPGPGTPPDQAPRRDQVHPPPDAGRDGYCYGRYASYWNAFLLQYIFIE